MVHHPGYDYSALCYLNQWLSRDRGFCEGVEAIGKQTRLRALRTAAAFYGVSRNLPTEFDRSERLAPLLAIVDSLHRSDFDNESVVENVLGVRDRIKSRYGDRGVLSLTTKILWLKFKKPIIVYDSRARNALGAKQGDLADYYRKWTREFSSVEGRISNACRSLVNVRDYCIDPKTATAAYLEKLGGEDWFKERVFDHYLWHRGRINSESLHLMGGPAR